MIEQPVILQDRREKIDDEANWREKLLRSKNFSCELEGKSRGTSAEENSYSWGKFGDQNRKERRRLILAV